MPSDSQHFFSSSASQRTSVTVLLWRALALLGIVLAIIGVMLPVMPTAPFVLLAAWAAGKGWPRLEAWMLAHPLFGVYIVRWRARRAIPRSAKWFATLAMLCSSVMLQFTGLPLAARLGVPAVMLAVALWIWQRPDQ
ncbi:hypothetical protein ADJ79_06230 [Ottowia sp. oral taxon 894]|uniref:YbaN family protein n=1 Tax=Ottowia sp. oral taxon 894 TaxID=1658672 RepID=UPI00067F98C4|nr:YbaN family protein [Ottowia sp. oral taxon 894]AKU66916.1 hypothetical protein ADJ79_06230 [Ottowia sp. oral taxon 894]